MVEALRVFDSPSKEPYCEFKKIIIGTVETVHR
jgi:hypothetical protein